ERDLRVALRIQEVLGAQVAIPVFVARVDAGGVDLHLDGGRVDVLLVDRDGTAEPLEPAAHRGDHQVLDRELHARVHGIDRPGRDLGHARLHGARFFGKGAARPRPGPPSGAKRCDHRARRRVALPWPAAAGRYILVVAWRPGPLVRTPGGEWAAAPAPHVAGPRRERG